MDSAVQELSILQPVVSLTTDISVGWTIQKERKTKAATIVKSWPVGSAGFGGSQMMVVRECCNSDDFPLLDTLQSAVLDRILGAHRLLACWSWTEFKHCLWASKQTLQVQTPCLTLQSNCLSIEINASSPGAAACFQSATETVHMLANCFPHWGMSDNISRYHSDFAKGFLNAHTLLIEKA